MTEATQTLRDRIEHAITVGYLLRENCWEMAIRVERTVNEHTAAQYVDSRKIVEVKPGCPPS